MVLESQPGSVRTLECRGYAGDDRKSQESSNKSMNFYDYTARRVSGRIDEDLRQHDRGQVVSVSGCDKVLRPPWVSIGDQVE